MSVNKCLTVFMQLFSCRVTLYTSISAKEICVSFYNHVSCVVWMIPVSDTGEYWSVSVLYCTIVRVVSEEILNP